MNGDTPMDARVSVLESDSRRMEELLKDHNSRLQIIEACMPTISQIKEDIKTILVEIRTMRDKNIADDAIAHNNSSWWTSFWGRVAWDVIRGVAIVVITLLVNAQLHILGG